jgi:hypothetical protein
MYSFNNFIFLPILISVFVTTYLNDAKVIISMFERTAESEFVECKSHFIFFLLQTHWHKHEVQTSAFVTRTKIPYKKLSDTSQLSVSHDSLMPSILS